MEKLVVVSSNHGHLYLLLGEDWGGEMIMCAQGWPKALGGGTN